MDLDTFSGDHYRNSTCMATIQDDLKVAYVKDAPHYEVHQGDKNPEMEAEVAKKRGKVRDWGYCYIKEPKSDCCTVQVLLPCLSQVLLEQAMSSEKDKDQQQSQEETPYKLVMDQDQRKFTEWDAIFGQGGRANQIRSGSRFRQLIVKHSDAYSSIPARDSTSKHKFVYQQVVNPLKEKGGRFFCLEGGNIKMLDLQIKTDARVMMTKLQQALRDERKRTRAQMRQKAAKNAANNEVPSKAGPYDTVFGQHAAAKKARQGSVFEKLISSLCDTYFAMDKQYNQHAPYTKYDFCREQVVKPLLAQGGRFFYIKGGELAELKYHENADCKVIMARIQQSFDLELKRRNQIANSPHQHHSKDAIRVANFHQRNLPSTGSPGTQQQQASATSSIYTSAANTNNNQPMEILSNFSSSFGNNKTAVDANGHPVIGATDTAMEALREACQPYKGTGRPDGALSNTNNNNKSANDENNQNMSDAPRYNRHDLGEDYGKLYTKKDTFFGSALEHYHQKSDFCAMITQHCSAYTSVATDDFRTRQEFVFAKIMEPLLENEGRFFILQEGVMKELDLYDEIDCRILLTSIQQAFFDENKRRKQRNKAAAAAAAGKSEGGDNKDKDPKKSSTGNTGSSTANGNNSSKPSSTSTTNKTEESGGGGEEEEETDDEDDGMFSDAEENTVQPVMGIDEESMHSLFANLRDKIQLTV
ncbi:expressed unknown protein [Seminavis robusta]|uniref:DUF6824 domain-containing protein n=1 Tax=Seminavis robusta TaxID=568900 RepID=A0A9N8HU49_9STRA|nr:expressed unknown protein [Seminavis robusta]|eukprot:Sro1756_g295660.1 n/a (700) ;mRNA; r:18882-21789